MTDLDTFETALLAELRREVAEHPAPAPGLRRPPRGRLRVAVAGAAAAAAAVVAAVSLTGAGPTASPAFAVEGNADGSVDIAIFRLDDADGLEAAMAEHGIEAAVDFVSVAEGNTPPEPEVDGTYGAPPASCGIDDGPGPVMLVPAWALEATDTMPSGSKFDEAEYVLHVRPGSPLFERPVVFDVGSPGSISMAYPSTVPGKYCFYGQGPMHPAPGARTAG